MRIVATFETGKSAFTVRRYRGDDGALRLMTGRSQGGESLRVMERRYDPARIEHGPNVVVEAALRPEPDCLVDPATGFKYFPFEPGILHAILTGLAAGALTLEGGLLRGLWTFKRCRKGGAVAIVPHTGALPQPKGAPRVKAAKKTKPVVDDTHGAPDLSDFIRTLNP